MSETKAKEKEGWYPGKFVGRRRSEAPKKDKVEESHIKSDLSFSEADVKRSMSVSESSASRSSSMPIAGKPPVKTVGNVIIKILGVKYMSATRPSFEVWLGSQVETFQFMGLEGDGSSTEEFEGFFSLGDLTSDIVVLVKEEYSVGGKSKEGGNFVGRVVIPISSYLTLKGRSAPKKEWMAVYPIGNPKNPMEEFEAGLNELPASGLAKSKQSLGFLCVQIELLLPEGPVYKQYLEGEPPRQSRRVIAPTELSSEGISSGESEYQSGSGSFDPEKFFRICLRLRNFLSMPPAALGPVLKFPEVFVLIALHWFLCFGASASNVPLILFFVVILNGVLSKKNYKVTLWNEMLDHDSSSVLVDPHTGKPLSLALKRSPEYVYQHLQRPLYDCQVFIEKLVNSLEVTSNICNFSDIRASIIFYGFFGALSLISTVILIIFSARVLFFLLGAAALLLNSLREVFPELFSLDLLFDMMTTEDHDDKFQAVRNVFTKLWLVLARVPNEKTMVHRHIARSCIVDEDGEEMKDAALKMKNM